MEKRLPGSVHLQSIVAILLLSLSMMSFASQTAKQYKGEAAAEAAAAPSPPRKIYKGETDSTAYATASIPDQAKYGGQVYTSSLYQGEIEAQGYSPTTDRSLHDGFYLGAEIGYDSYKLPESIDIVQNGASVFQQNPQLNAVGVAYSLVAGFGRYFDDPIYIGTEFFYNYSLANTDQTVGIYPGDPNTDMYYIKSDIEGNYGISLLPGLKLSDSTLLYIKGGYTRLDVKTYESSVVLGINNAQSNGVNGVHLGMGFETVVYKNLSVRGEYTHLNCKSFKTETGTTVSPSNNQAMFGLIFHLL